jgi:hypothetical protein
VETKTIVAYLKLFFQQVLLRGIGKPKKISLKRARL